MNASNRFQDENLSVSDFYNEVWVVCPACTQKAIATTNYDTKKARLGCLHCGHTKEVSTAVGKSGTLRMEAHAFFGAELWLQTAFKNEVLWAYNDRHLDYLQHYIGAGLREHKNRTHFTMLEKLPKFMQLAKHRAGLLKLIRKLKEKG
ncbi:hypothetical protein [Parapedobacter sp. DT-150]|uniref:hypothetical protein n=1 Tax=Parapedobacter sp. DT-150 TaxID=3396162 RepID=UPI003F1C1BE7